MSITGKAADALRFGFLRLFRDRRLVKSITIRQIGATVWDDSLGHNVTTTTDKVVNAIEGQHTKKSADQAKSLEVQVGDRYYTVMWADIPKDNLDEMTLTVSDLIIVGGRALTIKDIDPRLDVAVLITVQGS